MNDQDKFDWMVCVRCLTFNHAPYIVDAMNGFTMQKTDFPFVCVVVDDASTDGEQEVIKNYLNEHFDLEDKMIARHEETDDYVLTFARHKTNLHCFFAVLYLKYNHYSIKKIKNPYYSQWQDKAKYIALCEGDDYWIDCLKLQKQVDFLENHPDFGLCHTNFKCQCGDSLFPSKQRGCEDYESLVMNSGVGTLTALFRAHLYFDYNKDINPSVRGWKLGDAPLWIYMAAKQKVKYLNAITSTYRVLSESASHSKDVEKLIEFRQSSYEARKFMLLYLTKHDAKQEQMLKMLFEKRLVIAVVAEYAGNGYVKKSISFFRKHWNSVSYRTVIICISHIIYGLVRKVLKFT